MICRKYIWWADTYDVYVIIFIYDILYNINQIQRHILPSFYKIWIHLFNWHMTWVIFKNKGLKYHSLNIFSLLSPPKKWICVIRKADYGPHSGNKCVAIYQVLELGNKASTQRPPHRNIQRYNFPMSSILVTFLKSSTFFLVVSPWLNLIDFVVNPLFILSFCPFKNESDFIPISIFYLLLIRSWIQNQLKQFSLPFSEPTLIPESRIISPLWNPDLVEGESNLIEACTMHR